MSLIWPPVPVYEDTKIVEQPIDLETITARMTSNAINVIGIFILMFIFTYFLIHFVLTFFFLPFIQNKVLLIIALSSYTWLIMKHIFHFSLQKNLKDVAFEENMVCMEKKKGKKSYFNFFFKKKVI